MNSPIVSIQGLVENLETHFFVEIEFVSLREEDDCVGIGETNVKVYYHQEDGEVRFEFEFNKVKGHGNKHHVLKISFNETDKIKPKQMRYSKRNQDLGSPNKCSLDGSTNRFLIKLSYLARILIFLISFQSTFTGSKAESSEYIQNVTTAIGDSIQLDCRTSDAIEWTHKRIDYPTLDDIYMDGLGLISDYKMDGRHSLVNGTKNLRITNINKDDAGMYRCTIKQSWNDIVVFNLAVAVSNLVCSMNPNWNDIVGENDCGIDPDNIRFNCSVEYYGLFAPTLQWRNSEQLDVIENGIQTSMARHYFESLLSITASLKLNGTHFVCHINESRSNDNRFTWHSPPLNNFQYLFNSSRTIEAPKSGEIHCLANSSQSCDYQWINEQHQYAYTIKGSILNPRKDVIRKGNYRCRAECRIRNKTCVVLPLRTTMNDESAADGLDWWQTVMLCVIVLASLVVVIVILVHIWHHLCTGRRSDDESTSPALLTTRNVAIRSDNELPELALLTTRGIPLFIRGVSRTEKVTGLVLFETMIYLICSKSNKIKIFYNDDSLEEPADEISIDDMENPWDITCSEVNKSLYISDKSHQCVWNIRMPDREIRKWKTDGQPRGVSITQDNELLLVTCRDESKEFSLDIMRSVDETVHLPIEMTEVWQAIRLSNGNFMIAHNEKGQHRISEVSFDGGASLRTFGLESTGRGSPNPSIDRIAGDILFVIDPLAERVYSLNTGASQRTEIPLMISQCHLKLMMRLFLIEKMKKRIGGHWLKMSPLASDWSKQ